jgi:hypothetical protein
VNRTRAKLEKRTLKKRRFVGANFRTKVPTERGFPSPQPAISLKEFELRMAGLLRVFSSCQVEGRAAAVAFTIAGYPSKDATIEILLAMQRGGISEFGHRIGSGCVPLTNRHCCRYRGARDTLY